MKACIIRSIIHYLYDTSSLPVSIFGNSPQNYVGFIHFCSLINRKTALLQALNLKVIKNFLIRAANEGQKRKPLWPSSSAPPFCPGRAMPPWDGAGLPLGDLRRAPTSRGAT